MKPLKVGDRVMAVKKSSHLAEFEEGWEGIIKEISDIIPNIYVFWDDDNDNWWAEPDEIELIEEPESKPFPTEDDFWEWVDDRHDGNPFVKEIYDYFAQFGTQPNRLEQLRSKHPNLTDTEKTELIELLLTQQTK
jgi:hypothetical protein